MGFQELKDEPVLGSQFLSSRIYINRHGYSWSILRDVWSFKVYYIGSRCSVPDNVSYDALGLGTVCLNTERLAKTLEAISEGVALVIKIFRLAFFYVDQ